MAVRQINVTQLKCACLDTEWREAWLRDKNPSTMLSSPGGTRPVYGTLFHKIAENYVGWLTSSEGTGRLADEKALWHEMYERFAEEKLTGLLKSEKIDSAYHVGQALKVFCQRVSALRHRTPGFQSWQDIYLTKEFSVRDVRFDVGASSIFISGQIDAVRTHPDHGLEIVDYKLSHGANMKHDLLQIAIYAKLLAMTKPGLRFHGVLEYYEPKLNEVTVKVEELDTIFDEFVRPVLYELVGETAPSLAASSHDDLSEKIRKCYTDFKLKVEIIDNIEAPQLIRYKVKPASGVKVVSLASRAEDLQVTLSLKKPPLIRPAQGCVTIDIPKENPDTVFWRNIVNDPVYAGDESFVSYPIGTGIDNRVIIADFADPNMCHALVAGASGSGKSEFLKSLVASLIAKNGPGTLKLSIIDPKILTFGSFSDCAYLTDPIITDVSSAIPCLQSAVEEMDERYQQLGSEGFEDMSKRFRAGRKEVPFYVIIFDEFADLILAGKEEKKEFERLVARLAAKGRAAGIHLVLTTQRPDRKIVTGLIKSNLPLKVCLRVTTSGNSQIILDKTGGESLLGRGDLLCDRGKGIERAQSPYIPRDELLQLTKKGLC
ncbi:DNA translocase FtsK [Desulfococcaceae bacterium HSG8]|nr:DNA translocase FtsK [Desulfococcaceae bacterium HSG8]